MKVILYKNKSPKNKIVKSLSSSLEYDNVRFTENSALNVRTPSVLLNISDTVADLVKYNYAYIPIFHRYYYIEKMSTEGALCRVDLISDPLMSFQKDILNSKQYVIRSQTLQNPYIADTKIPMKSKKMYHQTLIGNEVDWKACPYVIMETVGKGGNT